MSLTITKVQDRKTKKAASFNKQKKLAIDIGKLLDKHKLHGTISLKAR